MPNRHTRQFASLLKKKSVRTLQKKSFLNLYTSHPENKRRQSILVITFSYSLVKVRSKNVASNFTIDTFNQEAEMHQTNGTGPLWPLSKPTQIKTVNIVAGLSCIIVGLILLSGAITISMFSHWGITETLIVSLTIIIVTVTMMIGFAGKSWRNVGITSTITVFLAIIVLTSFQSISLLQITSVFLEILVGFEISTSFFDKQWEEKLKVMVWALFVSLVLIALTWAIALHWHTLTLFSNALVLVLLAIIFVMAVLGVFAYRNLNSQLVRLRYGSAPTLNSVTEAELNAAIEKAFMAAMKDIAERDSETGEALDKIAKYATNTHALLNNLTERYVASSKKSEV